MCNCFSATEPIIQNLRGYIYFRCARGFLAAWTRIFKYATKYAVRQLSKNFCRKHFFSMCTWIFGYGAYYSKFTWIHFFFDVRVVFLAAWTKIFKYATKYTVRQLNKNYCRKHFFSMCTMAENSKLTGQHFFLSARENFGRVAEYSRKNEKII